MSNLSLQILGQSGRVYDYTDGVVRIGRDSTNDIVLADAPKVSRHHAEIRNLNGNWQVIDLKSTNGTYLNGKRISESSHICDTDELRFGPHGPRIRVSLPGTQGKTAPETGAHGPRIRVPLPGTQGKTVPEMSTPKKQTDGTRTSEVKAPSESELFPWRMGLEPLKARGYLIPGLITVLAFGGFMWALNQDLVNAIRIILLYFVVASTFLLYRLCGKVKSLWVLIGSAALTFFVVSAAHDIVLYPIKTMILPLFGNVMPENFPGRFMFFLFVAGIPEEFEKMLPALIGLAIFLRRNRLRRQSSPLAAEWEVREPLDAILLAVAAAAGFNFAESFLYAVKPIIEQQAALITNQTLINMCLSDPTKNLAICAKLLGMGPELLRTGFERGLSVFTEVIVRGVFDIFGHQAYAGICAYYVGLVALRPKYKASLIIRGYIIAALLHAAYDATGGFFFQFILTAIPFVLLVTVILQGRKISPTRMQNFATLFGQKA